MLNPRKCENGKEQFEKFMPRTKENGWRIYQYDYRTPSGELFSCCARTLESARRQRDEWLAKQNKEVKQKQTITG